MTIRKALTLAVCTACLASMLCSCSNGDSSESSKTPEINSTIDGIPPVEQEIISYEFPQFLNNAENISIYSNMVYNSFDATAMNVAVDEQPFDSLTCEYSFANGAYYSFFSGDKKGIINAEGIILVAANYSQIAMVRPDTFLLTNDKGEEKFAFVGENGIISTENDGKNNWFTTETPLQIKNSDDVENLTATCYLEAANGKIVYNQYWDYIEPINLDIASTASYSAYQGNAYFYLVFDKYYNYKVYEGSYATVEVFVDGQYGSCFILDSDDFDEISSMIDSFGVSDELRASPKATNGDYVKFVFGNRKSTVTISEDGFCYTEEIAEDGTNYKYFSIVDKLCFSDVIRWIDLTLSEEYS